MRKLIMLLAVAVLAATGTAFAARARPDSGVVYAGVTHQEGKDVYVSGDLKDKLLGRGAIVYITNVSGSSTGVRIKARKITAYYPNGSLVGSGAADQTGTGNATKVSNGTFSLTKGTGAYRGHTLKGTFSGTQKDGVYRFTYKGTYR